MKKKFKNLLSILLVLVCSIALIGCGSNKASTTEGKEVALEKNNTQESYKENSNEEKNESFTIVDSYDRSVEFDKIPEKIVVLNSDIYQLICLLGGKDKVIGISESVKFPEPPATAEVVGAWNDINVEKVLEVAPDVVFGYGKYTDDDVKNKLESAGIKVLFIDSYKFTQMPSEVTKIGEILGAEDKAKEFNEFIKKYTDIIKERVANIPDEEKVNVYCEGYTDYKTVANGSGGQEILNAACVRNIAENEEGDYPEISDEWVIERNPSVILKTVSETKGILGYNSEDLSKAEETYNTLISRTGWENLDAVKNNKVYILDSSIIFSPHGSIVGALQIAKICYPDKFEDINIEDIHKQIYENFYGIELKGNFIYGGDN